MEKYKIPAEDPQPTDIERFARSIGSHFFETETMQYFSSVLERPVYSDGKHGALFVTSDQLTMTIKREIAGGMLKDIDNVVDRLTGVRTVRSTDMLDIDEPRCWKVRYADYEKETVRSYELLSDYRCVCLEDADNKAREAAEQIRNGNVA